MIIFYLLALVYPEEIIFEFSSSKFILNIKVKTRRSYSVTVTPRWYYNKTKFLRNLNSNDINVIRKGPKNIQTDG